MNFVKDKKVIALIAILLVFTISYFVIVNHLSYAFTNKADANESYNALINIIKKSAKVYAEQNSDIFKNEKISYIKVQDLIDSNLLATNSEGNVVNPLDQSQVLNSNIIKLKLEDEEIIVSVDS